VESGLQVYLKQINDAPLLSAEEERSLALHIRSATEADQRFVAGEISVAEKDRLEQEANRAREKMVRSNLRLVVNIAKNYSSRGMPLADIIEEGNLGLLRAVEGFDPDQGSRFSTYASWWIKQAIRRALINSVQPIHIPAYMVEEIARWKQASSELEEKFGRTPTLQEMADHLKIPERKVRIIRRAVKAFSSPTQSGSADAEFTLSEMLADEKTPAPEQALFSEIEASTIQRFLDQIDEREAKILRLRYGLNDGEPKTLKEIGEEIGLTRERVRQIEHEALAKLNALFEQE
jgi:RNA polymerase primary sigma factor